MQAKAKTEAVQERADALFGRCVRPANAAHVPGTTLFCEPVFVHRKVLTQRCIEGKVFRQSPEHGRRNRPRYPSARSLRASLGRVLPLRSTFIGPALRDLWFAISHRGLTGNSFAAS